jgi:hypothetical protein
VIGMSLAVRIPQVDDAGQEWDQCLDGCHSEYRLMAGKIVTAPVARAPRWVQKKIAPLPFRYSPLPSIHVDMYSGFSYSSASFVRCRG